MMANSLGPDITDFRQAVVVWQGAKLWQAAHDLKKLGFLSVQILNRSDMRFTLTEAGQARLAEVDAAREAKGR